MLCVPPVAAWAAAMTLVVSVASAESTFSTYRGIALGDALPAVAESLKLNLSDVTLVHESPSLIQELTWRPHQLVSGVTLPPDPLWDAVLTFHRGLLVRIIVTYDDNRTRGLTDADLRELFGEVYGSSMLPSRSTEPTAVLRSGADTIGRWADADTIVVLRRESYPKLLKLTILATVPGLEMQEAMAEAVRLAAIGAPARELARQTTAAAAVRDRDEKTRVQNRAAFKP
jgi:hypothetical protein